jgi:hypothetical protein
LTIIEKNETGLAGLIRLEKETTTRSEPKKNLATGFSPIQITLGKKDTNTGPDAALASSGIQCVYDVIYMATLFIGNCLEYIDLDIGGHKDLVGFKGDFFHSFHKMSW